ncbi:hypothetical protein H4R26_001465 [Coemansia thaxteri]|uniref:Uncharacterized protein n=1 Tax=Coemansia thaxteri TaxID=2663907 RepID=A0A9W8BER1_9FUNG|nr:hypothetical protein H4R26_001465 [Coemansia thaxteri]KAJ2487992.1 hypothetical protein EV174_000229 [Coemansia sp. RSA 2320]
MRFRTLTGVQRHKVTNLLFFAGVVSAIGTVTGSNLLGCPAVNRENRLDDEQIDDGTPRRSGPRHLTAAPALQGKEEQRYIGCKIETVPSIAKDAFRAEK